MAQRTICIQNPSKLSTAHSALRIMQQGELIAEVPLEDIWVVIIETMQATITSAALSSLTQAGVGILICGKNHLPNGLLLPIHSHCRHAAIVKKQLEMSKPLMKRLWQQIVISKILNQARVLAILGEESQDVKKHAHAVTSGDTTNRESVAAATYFKRLIPDGTRRKGAYADIFDYGYGVLRAGLGKEAVINGWLVSQGIHHNNGMNPFNLVDDMIEPFRPIVDLLIRQESLQGAMSPFIKARLATIFEVIVECEGKRVSVQYAIKRLFESLQLAIKQSDAELLALPKVIELQFVKQE